MDSFDDEKNPRRKNPFDFIGDDEFERIFDEMQKMFENVNFKDLIEDMLRNGIEPNKHFVKGFSINIGPDGKPNVSQFGNKPLKTPTGSSKISDEREPLTDIIEGKNDIAITIEVPGVEKDNIDLNVTEDILEIKVDAPERKYHKLIDLPNRVKPKSTKATYKNGILDVVLDKKDNKKGKSGYSVSIK
jgi:HSP20 family protein